MELQTIGQVAKECGVSIRMLRYYEEIGLVESQRKGDGSYRVYDESTIERLRQIIVLRKLRVSVKQISEILNNPNAAAIVEIFKQNIDELDDEIATLATVKAILNQFIERVQEATQIKLALDFTSDESVLSAIEAINFTKNHKQENYTIEDINKVSKKLNRKSKLQNMRGIEIPKFRAVSSGRKTFEELFNEGGFQSWLSANEHLIQQQITDEAGFLWFEEDKPILIRPIKDNVTEAELAPYELYEFPGGLYLVATGDENDRDDLNETIDCMMDWINSHDAFEHGSLSEISAMCNLPAMCNMPNVGGAFDTVLGIAQQQVFIPLKLRAKITEAE